MQDCPEDKWMAGSMDQQRSRQVATELALSTAGQQLNWTTGLLGIFLPGCSWCTHCVVRRKAGGDKAINIAKHLHLYVTEADLPFLAMMCPWYHTNMKSYMCLQSELILINLLSDTLYVFLSVWCLGCPVQVLLFISSHTCIVTFQLQSGVKSWL